MSCRVITKWCEENHSDVRNMSYVLCFMEPNLTLVGTEPIRNLFGQTGSWHQNHKWPYLPTSSDSSLGNKQPSVLRKQFVFLLTTVS